MGTNFEIPDVESVVFKPGRWTVFIDVYLKDGKKVSYVASADSALADSGIYFATKEEHDEDMENLW